jgi:hypothetical protein
VDITVYLPDGLAKRAKDAGVNLSRMLRDALTDEFERQDAVETTLKDPEDFELRISAERGYYTGRIRGAKIAGSDRGDVEVFLTENENVVVYDTNKETYTVVEDPEDDLRNWLDDEAYVEAMSALGLEATVDLDV